MSLAERALPGTLPLEAKMAAINIYLSFLAEENYYSELYRELIAKSQKRNWTKDSVPCYVERHHIWPKSLGGSDESQNIVFLTASEHYYAHYYLMKMLENQNDESYIKMVYACWQMNNRIAPGKNLEREAKIYEEVRQRVSSSRFGKKLSEEHKQKISESLSGENHYFYGKKTL